MTAYYKAFVSDFEHAPVESVLGELTQRQTGTTPEQLESWRNQIDILRVTLGTLRQQLPEAAQWGLLLEYQLFRLHRRLDAVLLADDLIFVLEFKSGAPEFESTAIRQAEDYALDLRDFHAGSQNGKLIPILCCTKASAKEVGEVIFQDHVSQILLANTETLSRVVQEAYSQAHDATVSSISLVEWDRAAYAPVPNIIEAAELLYAAHSVYDIHAALAGQQNLTATTDRLIEVIAEAQRERKRIICFVTGVPGSGKTLTGLNAVHDPRFRAEGRTSGAFLSGNTPLVAVLREALAQDHYRRHDGRIEDARRRTKAEIQLLMRFLEEYVERDTQRAPHEHVIVYDEAQRAWDAAYGQRKFSRPASEPSLFLQVMGRHRDWAAIVALVGGGQEINRGEGGLQEWGKALAEFDVQSQGGSPWEVHASPHVIDGTAVTAGSALFPSGVPEQIHVITDERLHLPVSVRSHRCEQANDWIDAVLDGDQQMASTLAAGIEDFPIYLTRSLEDAKHWLQHETRGYRRCGLVASSGARRLRAYGLGVTLNAQDIGPICDWYLKPCGDVRASYALEVTANEYACQGLELDRVGLCWGGDMVWETSTNFWAYHVFRGTSWQTARQVEVRENTKNTYRVLMSRAREAMVIWVPHGNPEDPTRPCSPMDATASYLLACGMRALPA